MDYIEVGKKEGAKVETGGSKVDGDGYFILPTVFSNVSHFDRRPDMLAIHADPYAGRSGHANHRGGDIRSRRCYWALL